MNNLLLENPVQVFINQHLNDNLSKLALQPSPFTGLAMRDLVQQIESKQKCKHKLPTWFSATGIYFPPKLSVEQSSSELTATYKASLLSGRRLADLTGGMGVDCYYFAKQFEQVYHAELNAELSDDASHNFHALGIENIKCLAGDGIELLNALPKIDVVYLDPARRNQQQKKVFLLDDCTPNILNILDDLREKSDRIMLKTSPLIDLKYGIAALKTVREIHVVSIKNECKEIVWLIGQEAVDSPEISCANLMPHKENELFHFKADEEQNAQGLAFDLPQNYLYEPNSSILKAGAFNTVGVRLNVKKLHNNSHLYTSDSLKANFPGRAFKILEVFKPREFAKQFSGKKMNLSVRNFPLGVDKLKKKYKITDGGDAFTFFTTLMDGNHAVIVTEKAKR